MDVHDERANFAIVLKAIRQERGLFQADLAELAGVPQPFVSRLERGEQDLTVFANALRVIRALDLSPELLDRALDLRRRRPAAEASCTAESIDERPRRTRNRDGAVAASA